jgi:luciferase family oxidoreductase group 1
VQVHSSDEVPPQIPSILIRLVTEGGNAAQTFNTLDLARNAERLGYQRYWLPSTTNMPGIASAATAVDRPRGRGHVHIRVGSGGIMLPNHSPLVIAEQFGTLESLVPGRIDLGLGRAPGTDQAAARALRRYYENAEEFPADVVELLRYFEPATAGQSVRAVPGAGVEVEAWLLGSSPARPPPCSDRMRLHRTSHYGDGRSVGTYRREFRPSARRKDRTSALALNVIAADTDDEASTVHDPAAGIRQAPSRQLPSPPPLASAAEFDALHTDREGRCRSGTCVRGGRLDRHRACRHRCFRRGACAGRIAADRECL